MTHFENLENLFSILGGLIHTSAVTSPSVRMITAFT
jgi:hypothetical protein